MRSPGSSFLATVMPLDAFSGAICDSGTSASAGSVAATLASASKIPS